MKLPDNCAVRIIDLPNGVGGVISTDETGFCNIYINARHGYKAQRESLKHELRHMVEGDAFNDKSIQEAENQNGQ